MTGRDSAGPRLLWSHRAFLTVLLAVGAVFPGEQAGQATVLPAPSGPGAFVNFKTQGSAVTFYGASGWILLTLCTPEIVRVQAGPNGQDPLPVGPLVVRNQWDHVPYAMVDLGDRLEIDTRALEVDVHKQPLRVDFYTRQSRPLSVDRSGPTWDRNGVEDTRTCGADEPIYGFGLQFHSFNQRGKDRLLKTNADVPDDTGESHVVAPFFLSPLGYGIFLNSGGYTRFRVGSQDPTALSFRAPEKALDFFFFYGPSPREVMSGYTLVTGRMRMPPRWALGFWYRMKSDWNADHVERTATAFRDHRIPCDVVGLEPGWQSGAYPCTFEWNHDRFPDPPAFARWMTEHQFQLNLWEHAYTSKASPLYAQLLEAHGAANKTVWSGLVPDFSIQRVKELFARFQERETASLGVAGYKLDEDDGSDFTGGWFFPDDAQFPSGMTGAQMHNLFGYLYQRAIQEMYDQQDLRTFLLCRGNYAGAQAYPVAAYSDRYDLREYLRATCNSGFSGALWCPEIRGASTADEFIRRSELDLLSPVAMINAWENGVLPWDRGPEVEELFRRYDRFRMALAPYLYSAFWQDHQTGLPVVRALVMDYPEDRRTWAVDDEYLLGESLLVAPVLQGSSRSVYLPPGTWLDLSSGQPYSGGQSYVVEAPLAQEPLFVRSGAVLPLAAPTLYTDLAAPVTFWLYPGNRAGHGVLYADDGVTTHYLRGDRAELHLDLEAMKQGDVNFVLDSPTGRRRWLPGWITVAVSGCRTRPAGVWINGRSRRSLAVSAGAELSPSEILQGVKERAPTPLASAAGALPRPVHEVESWSYDPARRVLCLRLKVGDRETVRIAGVR